VNEQYVNSVAQWTPLVVEDVHFNSGEGASSPYTQISNPNSQEPAAKIVLGVMPDQFHTWGSGTGSDYPGWASRAIELTGSTRFFCSANADIEVHGIYSQVITDGGTYGDTVASGLASFSGCSPGGIATVPYANGSRSAFSRSGPQFPGREQIGNLAMGSNSTGQFVMSNAATGAAVCSYNGTTFSCNGSSSPLSSSATVTGATTVNDAACFADTSGTLEDCGTAPGTVTAFQAPASGWPGWLTPSVSNAATTPGLTVSASAIPASALASSTITVNGQSCALGGTCTVTPMPAAFVALTDGSAVTLATAGAGVSNAILTLNHATSSRTLNVTGLASGAQITVVLKQDATGGAALTLGSGCNWYLGGNAGFTASTTPSLSAAANAINLLAAVYDGTNCYANVR
jgi:hypothetical protein